MTKIEAFIKEKPFRCLKCAKKYRDALLVWKILGPLPVRQLYKEGKITHFRCDLKIFEPNTIPEYRDKNGMQQGQTAYNLMHSGVIRHEFKNGCGP